MAGKKIEENGPSKRSALRNASPHTNHLNSPGRRSVIRRIGAATAGILGISGTTAATDEPAWADAAVAAAREYNSESAIRSLVAEHASDLLEGLANEGYLSTPNPSALPLSIHESAESYANHAQGVGIFASYVDDALGVKVQIKQPLSNNKRLVLHIDPYTGRSSASVTDDSTGKTAFLTVASSNGDHNVDSGDCCYRWEQYCGYWCDAGGICGCVDYQVCAEPAYRPCECEVTGTAGCNCDSEDPVTCNNS